MTLSSARRTRCARLRRLLADQRWHRWDELWKVAGRRYGARLYDVRYGVDGGERLKVIGKTGNGYDWFWKLSSAPANRASPRAGRPRLEESAV